MTNTMSGMPVMFALLKLGNSCFSGSVEKHYNKAVVCGADKGGVRRQQVFGAFCAISGELFVLDVLLQAFRFLPFPFHCLFPAVRKKCMFQDWGFVSSALHPSVSLLVQAPVLPGSLVNESMQG